MTDFTITSQNIAQLRETILIGAPDRVTKVVFSRDSRLLALAGDPNDFSVSLWHVDSGERVHEWREDVSGLFAFAADGKQLWICTDSERVAFDTATGAINGRISLDLGGEQTAKFTELAVSPDGLYLVAGSWNNRATVWGMDGRLIMTLPHEIAVKQLAFMADGRQLVTRAGLPRKAQTVSFWDTATWERVNHFTFNEHTVWSMAVHPTLNQIALGLEAQKPDHRWSRNMIRVFEVRAEELVALGEPISYENYVLQQAFSPDGDLLAAITSDSQVHVIDADRVATVQGWSLPFVNGVSFSPDGTWLVTTCNPHVLRDEAGIRLLSKRTRSARATTQASLVVAENALRWSHVATLDGHARTVLCLAFSSDSKWIVSGGEDAMIHIWDLSELERVTPLRSFQAVGAVEAVAFHPFEVQFATLDLRRTVQVWSMQADGARHTRVMPRSTSGHLAFHPSGRYLAVHSSAIAVDDDLHDLCTFGPHGAPSNQCVFSPDGQLFAVGVGGITGYSDHVDDRAKIYDFESQELLVELKHGSNVIAVQFSPDARWLATIGWLHELSVWDWRAGERKLAYEAGVHALAFHPSGEWLALALLGGGIRVLRVDDWGNERPLAGFDAVARTLAFSPDGSTLAAAVGTGIEFWRVE